MQIIERTSSFSQEGFINEHIEKYFPFDRWGGFLPKPKKSNAATSYAEYMTYIYLYLNMAISKAS
jgi:hypothetical protein